MSPRHGEKQIRKVHPLPLREGERQLREVHPLPPWLAEKQLRGVQTGTRGSAEFEAGQARAREFARDQARTRVVHNPRLFRHWRVKESAKNAYRHNCLMFITKRV